MSAKNWQCPHCNRFVTIDYLRETSGILYLEIDNAKGKIAARTEFIVCPNPDCTEPTYSVELCEWYDGAMNTKKIARSLRSWRLYPQGSVRPFPDYVPVAIRNDYAEASLIVDMSPKASATLSRRCLQGMLRDFWKVKPGKLWNEIQEIKDRTDEITWSAIDAVREIGNIGAHMQKDIDTIVDVDPGEAEMLIELVETLISDWYVGRHQRHERMLAISAMAAAKKEPPQPASAK